MSMAMLAILRPGRGPLGTVTRNRGPSERSLNVLHVCMEWHQGDTDHALGNAVPKIIAVDDGIRKQAFQRVGRAATGAAYRQETPGTRAVTPQSVESKQVSCRAMDRPDLPLLRRSLTGFFLILTGRVVPVPSLIRMVGARHSWSTCCPSKSPPRLVDAASLRLMMSLVVTLLVLQRLPSEVHVVHLQCGARCTQQPAATFPKMGTELRWTTGFFLSLPCVPHVFFVSLLCSHRFSWTSRVFLRVATGFPCLCSLFFLFILFPFFVVFLFCSLVSRFSQFSSLVFFPSLSLSPVVVPCFVVRFIVLFLFPQFPVSQMVHLHVSSCPFFPLLLHLVLCVSSPLFHFVSFFRFSCFVLCLLNCPQFVWILYLDVGTDQLRPTAKLH